MKIAICDIGIFFRLITLNTSSLFAISHASMCLAYFSLLFQRKRVLKFADGVVAVHQMVGDRNDVEARLPEEVNGSSHLH
jgi:hypothetical protein